MPCPTCQVVCDSTDRFCRHCGAKLEPPAPVAEPEPPKTRRGRRRGPLTIEVVYSIGGETFTPEEFRAGGERVVLAMVREVYAVHQQRHNSKALSPREIETESAE